MKVWITKYALTKGIIVAEAKDRGDAQRKMCSVGYNYFHGNDSHTNPEHALRRAEEMRQAAIRSTEQRLKRLAKLTFMQLPRPKAPNFTEWPGTLP